jgi:cell division septation protein DedD
MADSQDTEITLGSGRLLGLFFGLVVVCAVFFGLGFSLGRNSVKAGALTMEETPASSATPSGSANSKTMAGTPEKVVPAAATQLSADSTQAATTSAAPQVVESPAVTNSAPAPEMAKQVSATVGGNGYTVQVAAVSKEEDADALVDALKKKSYPVFVASAVADKLFHVQVGPFGEIKDAEAMKAKLLGDGYNPIVKR